MGEQLVTPRRSDPASRQSARWIRVARSLIAFAIGTAGAWMLLRVTAPFWVAATAPLAVSSVQLVEPGPLTTAAAVAEDRVTLEFRHAYQHQAPRAPQIPLLPLVYGHAMWSGLAMAAPGLRARRRVRDFAIGLTTMTLVAWIALVVRVEYNYTQIQSAPFPALFDNWRGWTAYFLHSFFLEIGFFVVPVALSALLHRRAWATLIAG